MVYKAHLKDFNSLCTPYEQIRAGFIEFALERSRKATPMVIEAKGVKVAAQKVQHAEELLDLENIQGALLTAAGVSDKASKHITSDSENNENGEATEAGDLIREVIVPYADIRRSIIEQFVKEILVPSGTDFIEEFVFRFLLTRGDALGGAMRNIIGALAQKKLTRNIIASLRNADKSFECLLPIKKNIWVKGNSEKYQDYIENAKALTWKSGDEPRTLCFNKKVPIVDKNIDICLFNVLPREVPKVQKNKIAGHYLVLGELKGGIDPAGADEHWKTASTALNRIRDSFPNELQPKTFFLGAAIAKSMAEEIWSDLENGKLHNAANLTIEDQVASLCQWLISI